MNKQDKINSAEAAYAEAVAQAQAVPSGYTRRQVKKADKARKLAAIPTWRRVVGGVVGLGLVLVVVLSCTAINGAAKAEVEQCLEAAEAAGWDSSVPAIQNACADPDSRDRILEGEAE